MSKNFEGEYKEYLNAQAPDLWDRIEAGVDALGAAGDEKVVPITTGKSKAEKKKRRIRYQNYRMLASVAACLFALVLIVPVYFLTQNSGKDAASEAPMMAADGAVQNIELTNEESAVVTNDAAPEEEAMDDVTEVEIALEETQEEVIELAQGTEVATEEVALEDDGEILETEDGASTGQVALSEAEETDGILPEAAVEEGVPAQEDMQVTILGEGAAQEGGVMYTAVVVGSASSATISVFVPAESAVVLEAEKVYDVTAELSEDGTYYVALSVTAVE